MTQHPLTSYITGFSQLMKMKAWLLTGAILSVSRFSVLSLGNFLRHLYMLSLRGSYLFTLCCTACDDVLELGSTIMGLCMPHPAPCTPWQGCTSSCTGNELWCSSSVTSWIITRLSWIIAVLGSIPSSTCPRIWTVSRPPASRSSSVGLPGSGSPRCC